MSDVGKVTIENAQLIFRNFSGKEGPYNRAGEKSFSVLLPPDVAEEMARDGWNVKLLKPTDEGEAGAPYIQVAVNFSNVPPNIFLITSGGRTRLDEATCETLDWAEIRNADLIINPYSWEVQGKTGIKAYLKSLYVTIEEDELERKYAAMERGE